MRILLIIKKGKIMQRPNDVAPGDKFRVVNSWANMEFYKNGDVVEYEGEFRYLGGGIDQEGFRAKGIDSYIGWDEVEPFVEKGFQSNFDEFYDFSYDFATLARVDLSAGLPLPTNKKGFMDMLKDIPSRLKRALNKNLKAMYQLDWIDEDLEVTEAGEEVLIDFILDKFEDELGEIAIKKVKEIEKEK
jgi:hypothetical protein